MNYPSRLLMFIFYVSLTCPALAEPTAEVMPSAEVQDAAELEIDMSPQEAERWARLDYLSALAEKIDTYSAAFTQEKFTPLLREPVVSQGRVQVAGGVARWDTAQPYASIMMAEGGQLKLYYPDQATLEIYDLGDRMDQMAGSPVPDVAKLRAFFTLEELTITDDALMMVLLPRSDELAESIEEVLAEVDPKLGVLSRIEITDTNGETTAMMFRDITLNSAIDPASLKLEVPEATKIVRPLEATGG